MPQVYIYYYPKEGGLKKVIPVEYLVEHRSDLSIRLIRCSVALDASEIPDWLSPSKFNLMACPENVPPPGDPADETCLSVPDADTFRYKVYGKILSAEQSRGELNPDGPSRKPGE